MKVQSYINTPNPFHVSKLAEAIDRAFYSGNSHDSTKPVHAAYLHHFSKPGSCIRANLAYNTASYLGQIENDATTLAATVECLHNASLVLDDLQDGCPIRRGQSSVYSCYGAATAQGLTNCLVTASFACLSEFSITSLLPLLSRKVHEAVAETVHGQTDELLSKPAGEDLNRHLRASMLKSGPLFNLAISLPLIAANATAHLEAARHATYCFGLAYQLADDMTDRIQDATSSDHGNIALMLRRRSGQKDANSVVVRLTQSLLEQTHDYAEKLPDSSGIPLLELAEKLSFKIKKSYG